MNNTVEKTLLSDSEIVEMFLEKMEFEGNKNRLLEKKDFSTLERYLDKKISYKKREEGNIQDLIILADTPRKKKYVLNAIQLNKNNHKINCIVNILKNNLHKITITEYHSKCILVSYNTDLKKLANTLSSNEKVFVYLDF